MSSKGEINVAQSVTFLDDSNKSNSKTSFHDNTETPLLRACKSRDLNIVEQLLQNGADIQERDDAISALSWSAQSGHADVVECLLELGVDPNLPDGDGATPLQHAAERGHLEVVRCLAERGALADAAAASGPSALSRAARAGHLGAAQLLVEAGARVDGGGGGARGRTPLREAVDARRGRVLKYLLGQGADVDARDEDGVTALHTLIQGQRWAEARLLLTHGAQLRSGGPGDNHALSALIGARQWDIAECLVARGADIQHLSTEEKTALLHHVIDETITENTNVHNAFYSVIKLGNIEMFELLSEKLRLQSTTLHTVLSRAYEDIKIRNIPLLKDIENFIENKLIQFPILTKRDSSFGEERLSLEEVKLIIDDTTDNIEEVTRNYDDTNTDDSAVALSTYAIARNIHILKKTLKRTYHSVPWEEMQFCLINFMQYVMDVPYQDEMCRLLADKDRLLSHLGHFRTKLIEIKSSLKEDDINNKRNLPGRNSVVQNISATNPQFKNLYNDYEVIRNIYSLQKIYFYLNIVLSIDLCEDNEVGILAMQRALQVMGEYLKNTLESPNISDDIHRMLLNSAPRYAKQIITSLRDTLSHADSLTNRIELEEGKDPGFFQKVQNDIKKVGIDAAYIFYKKKIQAIEQFFKEITQCSSSEREDLEKRVRQCRFVKSHSTYITTREFENFNELTDEVKVSALNVQNDDNRDKHSERINSLRKIKEILKAEESKLRDIQESYEGTMKQLYEYCDSNVNRRMIKKLELPLSDSFTIEKSYFKEIEALLPKLNIPDDDSNTAQAVYKMNRIARLEIPQVVAIDDMHEDIRRSQHENKKILHSQIENVFKNIEESPIPETAKTKYREIRSKRIRTSKAKQILTTYFENKAKGGTAELLEESEYNQAIEDLTLKPKTTKDLQICNSKGDFTKCLQIIGRVGDKYAMLLNTIEEISFFSLEKYVGPFKIFFSHGNEGPQHLKTIIDTIHNKHKERILQYFEKRLSSLERITKLQAKGPVVQAAMEMLVLDLTEVLEHSGLLVDNYTFLLGNTPLLTGKSLRNYLAHGNLLVDLLPFSTSTAIATHAQVLLERGKELITRRDLLLGSPCAVDISQTRERHAQHLQVLATQIEMFTAAEKGDLEGVKDSIKRRADPNARSMKGLAALDFAVRGDSVEVFKFLVDTTLSININNVLHNAVLFGSINIVKHLTREYCLHLHGKSFREQQYLHTATSRGHDSIVKYALDSGSRNSSVDRSECTRLQPLIKADTEAERALNESLLHFASTFGCLEVVRLSLTRGAEVDSRCKLSNLTSLHLASMGGHIDVVDELLKNGSDVNVENSGGHGPLLLAITFCHYHVAKLLIQMGANVKVMDVDGQTPLLMAARDGQFDLVQALLKEGANVDAKNKDETTALHYASMQGHVEVVRLLLKHKAKVDERLKESLETALLCAARKGHAEIAKELLHSRAQIDARTSFRGTALHLACWEGHADVVSTLLDEGADVRSECLGHCTPLHYATMQNRREIVKILLERGADVDAASNEKLTALHIAAGRGFTELSKFLLLKDANAHSRTCDGHNPLHCACCAENGGAEVVGILLRHVCDVDAVDERDRTALHTAAFLGRGDVARALVDAGADVNALDCVRATPLHYAAKQGHKDIVELVWSSFNISRTTRGRTPLFSACVLGYKDVVSFLLEKGAAVHFPNKGFSALHIAALQGHCCLLDVLLSHGALVDERDKNDDTTALYVAVREGHKDFALSLLARGADVNARNDADGRTALHEATRLGLDEFVGALLKRGADANAASTTGVTALHVAAEFGHTETTRVLLAGGADPTLLDEDMRSPLEAAAASGHSDVVEALAGADPKRTPPARALFAAIAGRHVLAT